MRQIEVFKKLITRDKGSPGDADGRKKYRAMRDLAYIYFMDDPRSPYMHYPESDRSERVLEALQHTLDDKDDDLQAARDYYRSFETVTSKTLKELREALMVSTKLIKMMRVKIEHTLESEDISFEEIEVASNLMNDLMTKGTKTPQIIGVIQDLEEKLKKEQVGNSQVRGGGDLNPFEQ